MDLLKPLPPGRTFEQIQNHYLVEKAIAERLKNANREERKIIYATMYDELFTKVPDHPRLTRRENEQLTQIANKEKLSLVRKFLTPSTIFIEFAPGDCKFALEVANFAKTVYAIDISDQRSQGNVIPINFTLIIYDGYQLKGVNGSSVDLVFSDQFIEHLHPEDTRLHFALVYHILKPGGKYVFRTPHAFSGPYDISKYFSNVPQGFHLKEWTYIEIEQLLKELNFTNYYSIWQVKDIKLKLPFFYIKTCEHLLNKLPWRYKHVLSRYFIPSICVVAVK
jgi:SAM-dependent methyltransferase